MGKAIVRLNNSSSILDIYQMLFVSLMYLLKRLFIYIFYVDIKNYNSNKKAMGYKSELFRHIIKHTNSL
jgi:hypothetical protein